MFAGTLDKERTNLEMWGIYMPLTLIFWQNNGAFYIFDPASVNEAFPLFDDTVQNLGASIFRANLN